jgi:hypothetical protein
MAGTALRAVRRGGFRFLPEGENTSPGQSANRSMAVHDQPDASERRPCLSTTKNTRSCRRTTPSIRTATFSPRRATSRSSCSTWIDSTTLPQHPGGRPLHHDLVADLELRILHLDLHRRGLAVVVHHLADLALRMRRPVARPVGPLVERLAHEKPARQPAVKHRSKLAHQFLLATPPTPSGSRAAPCSRSRSPPHAGKRAPRCPRTPAPARDPRSSATPRPHRAACRGTAACTGPPGSAGSPARPGSPPCCPRRPPGTPAGTAAGTRRGSPTSHTATRT